jgi:oligopeptide/dipeptide ABC transporter ATP-binding protein
VVNHPDGPLIAAVAARRVFARQAAVDGVTLGIQAGETVALVGESGSGKSTLGRMLLGLETPDAGAITYRGAALRTLPRSEKMNFRRDVQAVFQDSAAALNPRRTILDSVALPLRYNLRRSIRQARDEAAALLDRVGLPAASFGARLPQALSGGQRQRVGIARAIACHPRFIVADEPVSALDVSVRAQVLRLFRDLQTEQGLACLFITHDLGVARAIAGRVAVMYRGALVELGTAAALLAAPRHPYTQALLASIPVADPAVRPATRVAPPPLTDVDTGCRFRARCPQAQPLCAQPPPLRRTPDGWATLCHFADGQPA